MSYRIKKIEPRSLYVSRKVMNASQIISWAATQGFSNIVPADKMHVTVIASRSPINWMLIGNADEWYADDGKGFKVPEGGPRVVEKLGENGSPVLMFGCSRLSHRNEAAMRLGASWDFKEYQPHITISYEPSDIDLESIKPYTGEIVLGPEIFEEFNPTWVDDNLNKFNIMKIDDEAQMVYGWASVIKENGIDVVDTQGDIIKAEELIAASTDFMQSARMSLSMHQGGAIGQVVHSFPMVGDLKKSLGLAGDKEGWIVGVKVNDMNVWKQVKSGELKAFSIGATAIREPV